jgi:hypothetical protein
VSAPKSYAEIGMPNYPLPLSQDGCHVLTASGVRFASIEPHWDELRLLVRDTDGVSAQMKENNLTRGAAMVVKAVNAHDANAARLFQGDCFACSFLTWAEQMRSVGRTLPGMEARENEARAFLTNPEGQP